MDISVDSKITVKIGDQEFILSKQEAESLHAGLSITLNKATSISLHTGETWGGNVNCFSQSDSTNNAYPYDQTK